MAKFQPKRLTKLANMLLADAKNKNDMKFDLHEVGVSVGGEGFEEGVDLINCGTAGCAMGLAAMSGQFKRAGLSYQIVKNFHGNPLLIGTTWKGFPLRYDYAACNLFGITKEVSDYLFDPYFYPKAKRKGAVGERFVAARIKSIVRRKGKLPNNVKTY